MEPIFHQLFDSQSSTFTYLLGDPVSREAVLIDPVLEHVERDLKLLGELELRLKYILDTHIHADHITGASALRHRTGAENGVSAEARADGSLLPLKGGDLLKFGTFQIEVIETPGHTNSCLTYKCGDRLFTGDVLMIRGNGRTDFQEGCAAKLYQSVTERLFTLDPATRIYPAHDYRGFTHSTIGDEMKHNPRFQKARCQADFVAIMAEVKLPQPKLIDVAVPANLKCGRVDPSKRDL